MIGTRAPSTMPAASALARKVRFLASMLPASRSGTTRICARPATADLMPLILRRLGIDGVVEGERPVEDAAGDLAAVGHLAQRGGLDGRRDLRRHGLDRREDRDPRRAEADLREQVDGVLDDVALGIEIGKDVDRRVGDEQRLGIGRHVHDEDVADPPRGAQAGLAGGRPRASARRCAGCPSSAARPCPRGSARRPWPRPPRCAARRRSRSGRCRGRARARPR